MKVAALMAVGAALTWGAVAGAGAAITRSANPSIALRFDGDNPDALALLAEKSLVTGDGVALRRAEQLALRAIAVEPLNPRALRVLGFVREASGNKSQARRLIAVAEAMTRRDVPAQLWLIEDAVARNRIPEALRHYDIALRVSPSAQSLLFPILTNALSEPEIRAGLAPFVRSRPSWLLAFLYHAIDLSEQPQHVAAMLAEAGGLPRSGEFTSLQPRMLARLAQLRRYSALRAYYRTLPQANPALLTTATVAPGAFSPSLQPVSWELSQDGNFNSAHDADKGGFEIFATSGSRGVAARKILFLKPGAYVLRSTQRVVTPAPDGGARWALICLADDGVTPLWRSANLASVRVIRDTISLPARGDCQAYALELEVSGGQGDAGFGLAVERLSLDAAAAAT